jgi:bisphosphoglycerate-dependent phosphoglycerate mutase
MAEIGPSFDLSFRRDKIAASDLYKVACRQPKSESAEHKRLNKNVYTDEFGQVKAKVFVQQQDTKTLVTRRYTKTKGNKLNENNLPNRHDKRKETKAKKNGMEAAETTEV